MKSRTKEDIIGKYMKDTESKANSLYSKGYKAGKNDGYALGREKADESFEMGSRMAIAALKHMWAHTDMTAERVLNLSDEEILKAVMTPPRGLVVGDVYRRKTYGMTYEVLAIIDEKEVEVRICEDGDGYSCICRMWADELLNKDRYELIVDGTIQWEKSDD